MQIKERFQVNGKNCYKVLDDTGLEYELTFRGLYSSELLDEMKAAGYQVLDYYGHIVTPDGVSIEDIALSDCTLSVAEIDAMESMDDFAVTEAEATAYFTRETERTLVELHKPVEVKIKTREELIKYLVNYSLLIRNNLGDEDCLPLNSFVAPEALFTFEEIQTDNMVRYYMDIIAKRREFRTYAAYQKVVKFLQSQGLLGDQFTAADVKRAYLSWGICGVKSMFTRLEDKTGVKTTIFNHESDASYRGGRIHKNLMNKTGQVISLNGSVPAMLDTEEYDESDIQPVNHNKYLKLYRDSRTWVTEYQCVDCWEPFYRTRTLGNLIDDSGVSYKMYLDTDTLVVKTLSGNVIIQPYLTIKTYNKVKLPIDNILNEEDYREWCLCSAKAHDIVEQLTMYSDVDSTFDLLSSEGLNKRDIIQYTARRIQENPDLNAHFDNSLDLTSAEELYSGTIPEVYLKKYNPNDLPYDTRDELIDIMSDTKSELEAQCKYLIVDKSSVMAESESRDEIELRPVEQLEFARDVLAGCVNIDYLAKGKKEDQNIDYIQVVELLKLCYATFGSGKTLEDFLLHIMDDSDMLDWNTVFSKREFAYWGAIKDTAELNALRARECVSAIYVRHVFREKSREAVERQRHYAFDCVMLRLDSKKSNPSVAIQNELAEHIKEAVSRTNFDYRLKEALTIEAAHIALQIMFHAAFDPNFEATYTDVPGIIRVRVDHQLRAEKVSLLVDIPQELFNELFDTSNFKEEICTLSDWCRTSFSYGIPRMYCLNANITPWRVIPRDGADLKSYNFQVNYISQGVYDNNLPEHVRIRCDEIGGRVTTIQYRESLIKGMDHSVKYNEDNTEYYMQNSTFLENFDLYYTRFRIVDTAAKESGKLLYRMRNKSDTLFSMYADPTSADYQDPERDEVVDYSDEIVNAWYEDVDVISLSDRNAKSALVAGLNTVEKFDIDTEAFSDVIRWQGLLDNSFKLTNAAVTIIGTKVLIVTGKGSITRDLQSISLEDCEKLVEKGIFYRLSAREFLVKATIGDYKVGVR